MKIHPDVIAAHAQFGGDLELMQKAYEHRDLEAKVSELKSVVRAILQQETFMMHDGYDQKGNYIYVEVIRVDDDALRAARAYMEGKR